MIYGIGTDIIEVSRVADLISKGDNFKEGVFTAAEIAYCESKKHKHQHYAGRFASKEAFLKALGTGWAKGTAFLHVEVINDEDGKPEIRLTDATLDMVNDKEIRKIYVSITHLKDYAVAMVVLET